MSPQELAAKVGETIGTSEWVEVTQEKINQFADATGDGIVARPGIAKRELLTRRLRRLAR